MSDDDVPVMPTFAASNDEIEAYRHGIALAEAKLSNMMIANSFATGHGDNFNALLRELEWQVRELRDTLSGLVGLIQLIETRDDMPKEMRDAIRANHRYVRAQAVIVLAQ